MSHIVIAAEWTGYTLWLAAGWALLTKTANVIDRFTSHRRRHRNARRRLAKWHPAKRNTRDSDHDVTRVMPGIQRPKRP